MAIITDEKLLRSIKCTDVLPEEVAELVATLERELEHSEKLGRKGIGLAAPQIGIAKKIAIIRIDNNHSVDLVNCRIDNAYDPALFTDEGCLSVPDRLEDTMRFQEVHVVDNLVYPNAFIATGLMSVVVQHELEHLESTLFFDKAIPKKMPIQLIIKAKLRPNDMCFCGKNKKYKKCCGN
jgi:peptide deformylase